MAEKPEALKPLESVEERIEFQLIWLENKVNWSDMEHGIYQGLSMAYQFVIREINELGKYGRGIKTS